jgi:hypothetical protein
MTLEVQMVQQAYSTSLSVTEMNLIMAVTCPRDGEQADLASLRFGNVASCRPRSYA